MGPDEYRRLLETHDWYWQHSDDYGRWSAGKQQQQQIMLLADTDPVLRGVYDEFFAEGQAA